MIRYVHICKHVPIHMVIVAVVVVAVVVTAVVVVAAAAPAVVVQGTWLICIDAVI